MLKTSKNGQKICEQWLLNLCWLMVLGDYTTQKILWIMCIYIYICVCGFIYRCSNPIGVFFRWSCDPLFPTMQLPACQKRPSGATARHNGLQEECFRLWYVRRFENVLIPTMNLQHFEMVSGCLYHQILAIVVYFVWYRLGCWKICQLDKDWQLSKLGMTAEWICFNLRMVQYLTYKSWTPSVG